MLKEQVIAAMQEVFQEYPFWSEHTLEVLHCAETITAGEQIDPNLSELIAIVAILHDIGAIEAKRKYGSWTAQYQERECPGVAREILERVGYDPTKTERVCYIVGHHHTPSRIDGIDFQIQWEADMLVNLQNMVIKDDVENLPGFIADNFKTATGQKLARQRYLQNTQNA